MMKVLSIVDVIFFFSICETYYINFLKKNILFLVNY